MQVSFQQSQIQNADNEIRLRLVRARAAAKRFFAFQEAEAKRLGYPSMAAFAKDIARGTVSLAPTPEDPEHEAVGDWFWKLTEVNRWALIFQFCRIDGRSPERLAKERFNWGRDKFKERIEKLLRDLSGALG